MKLDTIVKLRVAFAFIIVLILLSFVKSPYGYIIALAWLTIVIWQYFKQKK